MNLAATLTLYAYGTSEGVTKSWDTRGRGRKQDFKKWFGKSKVVDKQGKPLIVYHGSAPEGNEAALAKALGVKYEGRGGFLSPIKNDKYTVGRFFSSNSDVAKAYGPEVHEAYLKMEKPFVVDAKGEYYNDIPVPKEMRSWMVGDKAETDNIAEWAYKHGYDGVIVKNVLEPKKPIDNTHDYIVFNAKQIWEHK